MSGDLRDVAYIGLQVLMPLINYILPLYLQKQSLLNHQTYSITLLYGFIMSDNHSITGSTGQNSAAAEHQEPSFGDQSEGGNSNEYNFLKQDQERLDSLRLKGERLFAEGIQAHCTAAGSVEGGGLEREKEEAADGATAPKKSAAQSLSKPNSTNAHPPTDAPSLTG